MGREKKSLRVSAKIVALLLLTAVACRTIRNKQDLAGVESQIKKGSENKLTDVAKVANGSVPGLELQAVRVISETPGENARGLLIRLANHQNPLIRGAAYDGLATRKEPGTATMLLKTLKSNPKPDGAAILALGHLGDEDANEFLEEKINQKTQTRECLLALSLIPGDRSSAILLQFAKSGAIETRKQALEIVGNMRSDTARLTLEKISGDPADDQIARILAIQGLGVMNSPAALPALDNIYQSAAGNIEIKAALIRSIASIKGETEDQTLNRIQRNDWQKDFILDRLRKPPPDPRANDGKNLATRLAGYTGSPAVAKANQTLQMHATRPSPSSRHVRQTYEQLYPDLNARQIEGKMRQGLGDEQATRRLLADIDRNYASEPLRILAIQNYFGLSKMEAQKMLNTYRQNKL